MKKYICLLVLMLLPHVRGEAKSYTVETIPNVQLQDARRWVSNPDAILSERAEMAINSELSRLADSVGVEVAVVLVRSIGDEVLEPFATQLFAKWGIGNAEKDNGLLILFVADQRKISFETGYGIEGVLPDVVCKRIQEDEMLPLFRKGDIDGGMLRGVASVVSIVRDPQAAQELYTQRRVGQNDGAELWEQIKMVYWIADGVVFLLFLTMVWPRMKAKRYTNRYENYSDLIHLRSSLLGFTIFFPLPMVFLLIPYFWRLNRLRNRAYLCDRCGEKMRKLSEKEDDLHLSAGEQLEEQLKSVDYDVWLCKKCENRKILRYDSASTSYAKCPNCKAKTYAKSDEYMISHATTFSEGVGVRVYTCRHCKLRKEDRFSTPRIIVPPPPPPGGFRGGSGGFGGGGFGGGGFGGGRSGGGGASSGW